MPFLCAGIPLKQLSSISSLSRQNAGPWKNWKRFSTQNLRNSNVWKKRMEKVKRRNDRKGDDKSSERLEMMVKELKVPCRHYKHKLIDYTLCRSTTKLNHRNTSRHPPTQFHRKFSTSPANFFIIREVKQSTRTKTKRFQRRTKYPFSVSRPVHTVVGEGLCVRDD